MLCDQCGTDNPDINRFCGACGAALFRRPELWQPPSERRRHFQSEVQEQEPVANPTNRQVPQRPTPEPASQPRFESSATVSESVAVSNHEHSEPIQLAEPEEYRPISGPSLLGLSDAPEYEESDEPDPAYLVDEQTPQRSVGWTLFGVLAVAILITFGVLEYRAIKTGKVSIPWLTSSNSEHSNAADQQPAENAANPSSAAQPATPPPLTSDEASAPVGNQSVAQNSSGPSAKSGTPKSGAETKTGDSQQPAMEVTQKKKPAEPPISTPEQPAEKASDEASTQDATARGAKEADAKRKQEMASEIEKEEAPTPDAKSGSDPEAVTASAKTSRTTATDPRQNKLLLTGERFLYGRGGRRDCNQAVGYFREAAKQYNGPAMTHLGAMYASGNCVQQNRLEAYKWFARAQEVQPNNQWLGRNMNMLWRQMTPQERASVSR
jgi:zinc-ribbon domain/Sel1 repeat